jgi:hypothetical protein
MAAVTFVGIEYVDAWRLREWCIENDVLCPANPSDFMKMAPYGVAAFVQAAVLFFLSLKVEERTRRRESDPSWQNLRN